MGTPATAFPKSETTFQRMRPGYVPGDLGFDPLGLAPEDPAEFRLMQEKELSHGRLAMIAAAGFLAQEAVTKATWGTYWGLPDFWTSTFERLVVPCRRLDSMTIASRLVPVRSLVAW